jgi:hypothetical protein
MLDVTSVHTAAAGARMNVKPMKTASMTELPLPKPARARARSLLTTTPPVFTVSGQPVAPTTEYRYLGVWRHCGGHRASAALHVRRLQPAMCAVQRAAATSGLRTLSIFHGLVIHTTSWRPKLTYAMHLYTPTVPLAIQRVDERVVYTIMDAAQVPVVALRSILGLPSWHAVLQLQQLSWLMSLLSRPVECAERQLLRTMVLTWQAKRHTALWWAGVADTLADMDRVVGVGGVDVHGLANGTALWSTTLTGAALCDPDACVHVPAARGNYRCALLAVEGARQACELDRHAVSLAEVRDLLVGHSFAPFIVAPRCKATRLMVLLRGGVRTLFGHTHFHVSVCPMCGLGDHFSVKHLVRDCPAFAVDRVQAWSAARTLAVDAGAMAHHAFGDQLDNWYLLTVGASVPNTFLAMDLDAPTHWARRRGQRATRHVRRNLPLYLSLLQCVGVLLCAVVDRTQEELDVRGQVLPRAPRHNTRRHVKQRWTAAQLTAFRAAAPATAAAAAATVAADADAAFAVAAVIP